MWAFWLHKYDFLTFIDGDSFLGSISSLVQCERRERYRTKQRHHTKAPEIPDFLFNQHLTGYYDIPIPFCLVDVALSSEGVGSVFYLSVIISESLFFFGPGCLLYFQCLYPRVSRYWDGSQRTNCVINNRGPEQREARWVFGGEGAVSFPVLN